jgi:hypothetical protein
MKKRKSESRGETTPVTLLERELRGLRRDLRATARAYTSRLDSDLQASLDAVESLAHPDKLPRETLHQVRDFAIMLRNRRLKPEKGRRKDLRKIDILINDLQPLAANGHQ